MDLNKNHKFRKGIKYYDKHDGINEITKIMKNKELSPKNICVYNYISIHSKSRRIRQKAKDILSSNQYYFEMWW